MIAGDVVLPQLHDGVGLAPGAGVAQADRLHRPEAQRVDAARRHDLDRQTAFEELRLIELVDAGLLGRHQRLVERLVFVPGERAIQIVALPIVHAAGGRNGGCPRFGAGETGAVPVFTNRVFWPVFENGGCPRFGAPETGAVPVFQAAAPAGGAIDLRAVQRLAGDDGADGVVEIEMRDANQRGNFCRQRVGRQRAGRQNDGTVG